MTNQAMIDQLKAKLAEWTPEKIKGYDDSADPNVLIGNTKETVIEWTDNGFYQIYPQTSELNIEANTLEHGSSERKISFTDCDIGHTYSLSQKFNLTDWDKYQKLYLAGINSKLFRIDVPLEREIVSVNGTDFEYVRLMRPGQYQGQHNTYSNTFSTDDYYNSAIDDYYNVMRSIIDIADNTNSVLNITFRHRHVDKDGVFYINHNMLWGYNLEETIRHTLFLAKRGLDSEKKFNNVSINLDEWAESAKTKWLSLIGK